MDAIGIGARTFGALGWIAALASAQTTQLASVDSNGVQGNNYSGLYGQSVSGNGRFVAFNSGATNLVSGGSPLQWEVFVHDFLTGATSIVSVDSAGNVGSAGSFHPSLCSDGHALVFSSDSGLGTNDTNGRRDIFLHDLVTGATTIVSVDASGNQFLGGACDAPAFSGDGGHVAFQFVISKTKYHFTDNVYVKDLGSGALTCASVDPSGNPTYLHSLDPAISSDGGFVAFYTNQDGLVAGDSNGHADVVLRDMAAGVSTLASVDSSGAASDGDSSDAAISADGRWVAFTSVATNLVASDTNGHADVFVRDAQAGTTTLVSVDSAGNQADADCLHPWLSADGRYVTFESAADDLVAGDTNGQTDVFIHDLASGTTALVSVDTGGGPSNGKSDAASLSADGRFVCFHSTASDLVASDTNGTDDVFLRGPWLTLEADPPAVTAGATLTLSSWRAASSAPLLLAAVGLNGTPLFDPILVGTCDATGAWMLSSTVPSGLAGNTIELQTFAIVPTGKVDSSAPVTVAFQ